MQITWEGRITAGDPLLDTDLRTLSVADGPEGPMLFAATGLNGGLTGWDLSGPGGTVVKNSVYYGFTALTLGPFAVLETSVTTRIFLGGTAGDELIYHDLNETGQLEEAATLDLPGRKPEAPGALVASALGKGQGALYGVEPESGALVGWRFDASGEVFGAVQLKGRAGDFRLDRADILVSATVDGSSFLLAGDAGGVTAYAQSGRTGALRATGELGAAQGIGIAAPTALETVSAFDGTWVVLAAAGSQSLTVMELSATGTLRPADHVLDTLATRFGGVAALEVVKTGDHVLVLAGGADDGISLFSLLPGGRLVHLQSLAHEAGRGLENVSGIESLVSGETLRIFVTSTASPGITEFALSLAELGDLIRPAATEAAARGSSGGDVMLSPGARRDLNGDEGDDVLVSGREGAVLTGGAGRDTFVITRSDKTTVITDFEIGQDRLDLSDLPGLRSPAQLRVNERDDMLVLDFAGQTIRVETAGGGISFDALFPGGRFETPDRIPFPIGPVGRFQDGTARGDRLTGGSGTDIIEGRGGNDRLIGRDGDDHLSGHRGHDRIFGNGGADTLLGQGGRDVLLGGRGIDNMAGGGGRDRLNGQGGDDRLTGGRGADTFRFSGTHGEDHITDFRPGLDVIELKTRAGTFQDLTLTRQGTDTWIDTGNGILILEDLAPRQISEADFLFL